MLMNIIKKEMLDTISSAKFVFTFIICAVMVLLSVYTGINTYRAELKEYNASLALNKSSLESAPDYNTLGYIQGINISKPPQVLSTVISGIHEAVGRMAKVDFIHDPQLTGSKYDSTPVFAVFGELDLTYVVKIVLSLLAILFSFDAIAGEKERGTLKLSLANCLPRDRLILGKAIGGFLSLMLSLVIPLGMALIMLAVYPDVFLSGEDWQRLGLILLLYFIYISVFFTLGLFVSSRSKSSAVSLLVLLFVWVTFVTIIPRAAVMVSGQIYPIPSMHEVTAEKDAVLKDNQIKLNRIFEEWNAKNPPSEDREEKLTKFMTEIVQQSMAQVDEKNAAIEEAYQAKRRKQEELAINLARISPSSTLMFGVMTLGRTGVREHERFLSSIKNYKPMFTDWITRNIPNQNAKPNLKDLPVYEYRNENLSLSLHSMLADFTVMGLFVILFFAGAFASFQRYDVR